MMSRPIASVRGRPLVSVSVAGVLLVFVGIAIGFALHPHNVAGAGGGGGGCFSTTSPACTFQSRNAFADFGSVSPDGCIFTDAAVQPFEALNRPGGTTTLAVFISIFKFDNCAGTQILGVTNVDPSTGFPVFAGTVQFGKLDTASVVGTATMFDFAPGGGTFTSDVNVTWTGFGPTTTFIDSTHVLGSGAVFTTHSKSTSRAAEASGIVTDETDSNVATPPTLNALLQDATAGTILINQT